MKNFTKLLIIICIIGLLPLYLTGQEADTAKVIGVDTTKVVEADATQTIQEEPKKKKSKFKDKIYYGGNIGLSFGNYFMVGVYPMIGYKLTPKLSAGIKIAYQYISDKSNDNNTYTASNYGGSLFARYRLIPQLYVHVEYAQMNYELYNSLGESNREWIPFLLVGAGYSQKLGGATYLNLQILFDVLQDSNSPYGSWEPFWGVGINVGF